MNLNEIVSVLWCSFIPHLSSCKNNALLKPSSARAVDLDISFGSWQIFSCFETKLKARLKVAMSICLIIWNTVTINITLPIKEIFSRMFSRWYADKSTFYRESSGFRLDFQASWCGHTGSNVGFLDMLDLHVYMHRKLTLFPENLLNMFSGVSVRWFLLWYPKSHSSQRKKWAERWDSSGESQVRLSFMCVMRGGLFLYPVSKHTCWDLWQCTLNSAISLPMETSS